MPHCPEPGELLFNLHLSSAVNLQNTLTSEMPSRGQLKNYLSDVFGLLVVYDTGLVQYGLVKIQYNSITDLLLYSALGQNIR